jgi:hypothetical protein
MKWIISNKSHWSGWKRSSDLWMEGGRTVDGKGTTRSLHPSTIHPQGFVHVSTGKRGKQGEE